MDKDKWTKTKTGRRVYDRRKRKIKWTDILRILTKGPGAPVWHASRGAYGSGKASGYVPMTYEEKKEYLAFVICQDTIGSFALYMDRMAFAAGEIARFYSELKYNDQVRFLRASEIRFEQLFAGLFEIAGAIADSDAVDVPKIDFKRPPKQVIPRSKETKSVKNY